ncbi:hypothetical protein [Clavibacter sp.]|uniref:hypothetical protein n=1 Tax=Clavibacter sp. TaxID=1871044 RepID=UPI0019C16BC8|nr:hypothetical protein [Clavibacter sp.]MBD5381904.1 hypothetical protein [Clavibacter sp.]
MASPVRDSKSIPDRPEPNLPSDRSLITLLIVVQVLMGMACIIGGFIMAAKSRDDGAVVFICGVLASVFMFTLAVVTAACKKILDK